MLPPFRQMKFEAKLIMMKSLPFWIKAMLLLIALQFAMDILVDQAGGTLANPILYPIDGSTNNLLTGFTHQNDRILLLVRLDILGVIAGATASLEALRIFFLYNGLFFLLLAPFKMGLLELLWRAFRGQELRFSDIFRWYTSPARIGKSVLVQFIVSVGSQLLALLAMVPGYLLYYLAYSGSFVTAQDSALLGVLSLAAITVLFIGFLAGFFFYAILAPLGYCLAAQPGYSLRQVFQKGFGSIRGYVKQFFYFRLSMFHWHIISILTLGIAELYIFPYITFSSLQFLQEAARGRKGAEERGGAGSPGE